MNMSNLEKFLVHKASINSIEVTDDPSIMKIVCKVLDFKPSHNKWGITEEVCEKYKYTLIGKHFVTKYYADTDTLGNHEDNKVKFREGDIEIPHKDTNSIGTVLDAWVDYIDKNDETQGKCLWCEGMLMVYEHLNEISLIESWLNQGIKVNLSIEWFYTESVIVDEIEWIANPTFSNICILNSEAKNGKPLVRGNYDIAELKMIEEMNNAILADYENSLNDKNDNKESEEMLKNRFLEALNSLSCGELSDKVYLALSSTMTADDFYDTWISDYNIYPNEGFFIAHTYTDDGVVYRKFTYTLDESENIVISGEGIPVKREEVWVTISEAQTQVDNALLEVKEQLNTVETERDTLKEKINELNGELQSAKVGKDEWEAKVQVLNSKIEELEPYKEEAIQKAFEQKINEKKDYYRVKFEALNAIQEFNSEDIQLKIKETLNSDELTSLKAERDIDKVLVELVKPVSNAKTTEGQYTELNSKLNNLIPMNEKEQRKSIYGF